MTALETLVHELRQPLTAILSNAQAAQRFLSDAQPDVQEVRVILEEIVLSDKRAAATLRLIEDILRRDCIASEGRGSQGESA